MPTKILYKYRPVNENTLRILTHTQLWASAPSTFNDLYECCFRTSERPLDELEWDKLRNWWRIFCFAGNKDSLLMWSHYAEHHQGICIGFTFDETKVRDLSEGRADGMIHRVAYPDNDEIPIVRTAGGAIDPNEFIPILTSKSRHWSYEEEYRLLAHPAYPDMRKHTTTGIPLEFPAEILTHVYLGARISQVDQNRVIEALLTRTHSVQLFKARRNAEMYALLFDQLGATRPSMQAVVSQIQDGNSPKTVPTFPFVTYVQSQFKGSDIQRFP